MFDRVRNQFVWTIMLIISMILTLAFVAIYASASISLTRQIDSQAQIRSQGLTAGDNIISFFQRQREEYARRALGELSATLLLSGVATMAVVYLLSRYIANRAIAPIEEAYNKQRQFVADASHELKTPITIIGANVDAAIADSKKPSKWLDNIQAEVEHTGKLVTDLLSLATLDTGQYQVQKKWFNAADVCNEAVEQFTILADERGLSLRSEIADTLPVLGDEDRLRQIINILIDNALKHTHKDGEIVVKSLRKGNATEIRVSNTHEHISDKELAKLFGRFYQSDESHSRRGHGLGLSIAKNVASQVNWSLSAKSGKNNVTFTLGIPR